MEWNWILEEYDDMVYVTEQVLICSIFLGKNSFLEKSTFAMRYSTEEIRLVLFVPTTT